MVKSMALVVLAVGVATGCAARRHPGLVEMAMTARTAGEHRAVAEVYRREAERVRRDSADHARLADWWAQLRVRRSGTAPARYEEADHCRRIAENLGETARELEALGTAHENRAREAVRNAH